ncbi:hypothetical protein ACS0TY_035662 [Phlomoides rotata]
MLLKGMEFDTAHFITDVSGKYPQLWALKGAHPVTLNRWYKFGVLASIRTIAPGFREISELPDWVGVTKQQIITFTDLNPKKLSQLIFHGNNFTDLPNGTLHYNPCIYSRVLEKQYVYI